MIDLDGTLVDTLGDFVAVLNLVLAELGLPAVEPGFVEHTVGRGSEHLIRSTLARVGAGAGAALYDEAWGRYQHHYEAVNGAHATVYPGVVEGLEALRSRGLPLAVLTNKPGEPARELLRRKGLDGYFSQVFGGDAFARKKHVPITLLKT